MVCRNALLVVPKCNTKYIWGRSTREASDFGGRCVSGINVVNHIEPQCCYPSEPMQRFLARGCNDKCSYMSIPHNKAMDSLLICRLERGAGGKHTRWPFDRYYFAYAYNIIAKVMNIKSELKRNFLSPHHPTSTARPNASNSRRSSSPPLPLSALQKIINHISLSYSAIPWSPYIKVPFVSLCQF